MEEKARFIFEHELQQRTMGPESAITPLAGGASGFGMTSRGGRQKMREALGKLTSASSATST
jgi:hypothetical protein